MNTVGIIAEYNPFHNGHLYQIEEIKNKANAQNIVVVMSGDFVQRGTPAWTDKYLRTKMALSCGVSCVFELPVSSATASAETFAFAGVSLLTSLGFVDGICFGCECGDIAFLKEISAFLANPTPEYELAVADFTSKGLSYPAAREKALCNTFPGQSRLCSALLSSPNNILALEYMKAITILHSPLIPFPIQRNDSGYHNHKLTGTFSSATAIRQKSLACPSNFPKEAAQAFPADVYGLLTRHTKHYPVTENHFSDLLYYRLSRLTEEDKNILDMTDEIFYRIQNKLSSYTTYSEFAMQIKTKQYTYSRISRVLLHCLLDIYTPLTFTTSQRPRGSRQMYMQACPLGSLLRRNNSRQYIPLVPYARLLGFLREKSSLLRTQAKLPVITKPADGLKDIKKFYSDTENDQTNKISFAMQMYQQDIYASNLYRQVQKSQFGCNRPDEYHSRPVILPHPFHTTPAQ